MKLLRVAGKGYRRPGYVKLLTQLHNTVYIYSVPLDRSRLEDGLYLRRGLWSVDDRPCSVLEMLVGLSQRMNAYLGNINDDVSGKLFWEFLENLGLTKYTDEHYSIQNVGLVLARWLNRRFEPNGIGGIFPLEHTERDQREVEIWSQMHEYMMNYYPNG